MSIACEVCSGLCVSQRVNDFFDPCFSQCVRVCACVCVCAPEGSHSCSCAHIVDDELFNVCKQKSPLGNMVPILHAAAVQGGGGQWVVHASVPPEEALCW